MSRPTPQALYHQLGQLRNKMPSARDLVKPESSQWIGQVQAVVEAVGDAIIDAATLRGCFDSIANHRVPSEKLTFKIAQSIDTVLAKLELKLPAQAQGAFIPAGGVFDGFAAVSKAMSGARSQVFLVDPYADDTLITDFVSLAPQGVSVLVLSDEQYAKPSLKPAADRWIAQYPDRPLEVRLAAPKSLHDRLVVTDGVDAWVVGQSFKDLAKRAHSSLVKMDAESGALKTQAHVDIWKAAKKLA
jgi:hypothetical protein